MKPYRTIVIATVLAALIAGGIVVSRSSGKRSFPNPDQSPRLSVTPESPEEPSEAASDRPVSGSGSAVAEPERIESTVQTPEEKTRQGADTKTSDVKGPAITDRPVAFGYEDRSSRDIDTVVVHSSYDALGSDPYSLPGVLEEYRQAGVSPHYIIDRKGSISRLVEDRDVAYHAGVSKMPDGRTGVNEFSLGIEVIGKDSDSPTTAQYASLRSLIAYLKGKYPIKYVFGHSDIAPGRKSDPWGFDWKEVR